MMSCSLASEACSSFLAVSSSVRRQSHSSPDVDVCHAGTPPPSPFTWSVVKARTSAETAEGKEEEEEGMAHLTWKFPKSAQRLMLRMQTRQRYLACKDGRQSRVNLNAANMSHQSIITSTPHTSSRSDGISDNSISRG